MKILLLVAIILSYSHTVMAQINVSSAAQPERQIQIVPFDSTSNFLGSQPHGYIGQRLFLLGNDMENNFTGFLLDYNIPASRENTYKSNWRSGSDYSKMVGKYFDVIEVIPHPRQGESSHFENNYILQLLDIETSDTVYFHYREGTSHTFFPFIVVGYFEKKLSTVKGEKYILSSTYYTERQSRYNAERVMRKDRNTGEQLSFNVGEVWTVTGLTIDTDNNYRLSYLLQNPRGNEIAIPDFAMERANQIYKIDRAESIVNQIGQETFHQILNREVQIGWPKSLVLLSLGDPRSVNSTVTNSIKSEQYVFGDNRFLYFENDILVSYQGNWMFGVPYLCYDCQE